MVQITVSDELARAIAEANAPVMLIVIPRGPGFRPNRTNGTSGQPHWHVRRSAKGNSTPDAGAGNVRFVANDRKSARLVE